MSVGETAAIAISIKCNFYYFKDGKNTTLKNSESFDEQEFNYVFDFYDSGNELMLLCFSEMSLLVFQVDLLRKVPHI